jgi:hypothetical protein
MYYDSPNASKERIDFLIKETKQRAIQPDENGKYYLGANTINFGSDGIDWFHEQHQISDFMDAMNNITNR